MEFEIPNCVKIIEPQILSFGTEEDLRSAIPILFKRCDPKIKDFKYYPFYDKVIKYLSNDNGKGMIIYREDGDNTVNNGLGKSVWINKIYPTLLWNVYKKSPIMLNGADFDRNILPKIDEILKIEGRQTLIFDEMCREPLEINDFGNKIKPMERIFDHADRFGWKIIGATNYTKSQVGAHYNSNHLSDRIRSLCLSIECSDISSRESAKNLFV